MSQFCTMPTGERKTQAAAICREVHGANGHVMDLGKKLCTPKDIMLEELSLMSNRGSRLFKMRQRRSEKYTFENIQNEANALLNSDPLTQNAEIHADGEKTSSGTGNAVNPQCIAPDVVVLESCEATSMPRCYYSPWEEAIINDPELAETIKLRMPPPEPRAVLPDYKCFNRVATPFGGFDRAPRGIRFKLPEVDLNPPSYPELQGGREMSRPTFNRTAQGWIADGSSLVLPCLALEPAEIPESDDL